MLLSAGKGGHVSFFEFFEIHEFQYAGYLLVDLRLGKFFFLYYSLSVRRLIGVAVTFQFQPVGDVVVNVQVREKGVTLENRIDRSFVRGNVRDVLSVQKDLARGGEFETRDHAESCRFAAPGRSEKGDEFAFAYVKVHLFDGNRAVELFFDVDQIDDLFFFIHKFISLGVARDFLVLRFAGKFRVSVVPALIRGFMRLFSRQRLRLPVSSQKFGGQETHRNFAVVSLGFSM